MTRFLILFGVVFWVFLWFFGGSRGFFWGAGDGTAPSSPVHNRRLLSARNIRMNSVELPDDNEKSQSSASASPCPSPVRL